jgi:hypothetical protein
MRTIATPNRASRSVPAHARYYIDRHGLQVTPLKPRTKIGAGSDLLRLIFKSEDFGPDDNIGIRSVNGVVVSDADTPEAVQLADAFLPPTGAVYGRPSKPRAKRLYRCPAITKPLAFKDYCATDRCGARGPDRSRCTHR